MRRPRSARFLLATALALAFALGACSSPDDPTDPSATVIAPVPTSVAADPSPQPEPSPGATEPAGPAPGAADPVEFFASQEAPCRTYAEGVGNPVVDAARFTGARQVDDLGGGDYLVEDGQGTRLRVRPDGGVVLPESGNETDLMPAPYGFGCRPAVFRGGSD